MPLASRLAVRTMVLFYKSLLSASTFSKPESQVLIFTWTSATLCRLPQQGTSRQNRQSRRTRQLRRSCRLQLGEYFIEPAPGRIFEEFEDEAVDKCSSEQESSDHKQTRGSHTDSSVHIASTPSELIAFHLACSKRRPMFNLSRLGKE